MFWIHFDSAESEVLFVLCHYYAVIKRLFLIKIFDVFITFSYTTYQKIKVLATTT